MQAFVLAFVGIGITVAVYGVVALIVKADDVGVALAKNDHGSAIGGIAVHLDVPLFSDAWFLIFLRAAGTAAMIWVGGGIIVHGLEAYGLHLAKPSIRCRSSCSRAAVRRRSDKMDSYRRPIGGRWTINRCGVDPSNRICRRTSIRNC